MTKGMEIAVKYFPVGHHYMAEEIDAALASRDKVIAAAVWVMKRIVEGHINIEELEYKAREVLALAEACGVKM